MVSINYRLLARILGYLALFNGVAFLPSAGWALYYGEYDALRGILVSSLIVWILGGLLRAWGKTAPKEFFQREALLLVALSWVAVSLMGALPFILTGVLSPVGAIFESVSGFTTTGASVIDNVEAVAKSVLFWRAFTHWWGGIGIVVLFIAVLPYLGAGGKQAFKVESSGPDPRALRPRVKEGALVLCYIYLTLTVLNTVAYLLTGKMDLFESLCHTFACLATGGFSTRTASIGAYNSLGVEIVSITFMVCGASSFSLYFGLAQRKWMTFFKDTEWRAFIFILATSILLIALNASGRLGDPQMPVPPGSANTPAARPIPTFGHALRASAFSATSLMTNTGFVTDDFDLWPDFSRLLLVVLMFIGGCAGSTAGGIKVIRIVMVAKIILRRIEATFRPYTVRALRIGNDVIAEEIQRDVCAFVIAYIFFFAFASLVMCLFGLPFISSISAVAALMSNTGPGMELLGGAETFSCVPPGGLLFLSLCMIVGRLELFTMLVLLVPGFWKVR
jgi:trk system potassium uptake protein TrkH